MELPVDMTDAEYRSPEQVRETAQEALVRLMDAYERPLFNFLVVLLRDREAAQDCAQDAFLRAYEHMQRGRKVTAPWLYKVARNRAVDDLRRRTRVQADVDRVDSMLRHAAAEPSGPVHHALAQLSPHERELLYLFDIDGFSAREIGVMLGIGQGAVHVRVFHARERFRSIYRHEGDTE